jgi:hypothetical protein
VGTVLVRADLAGWLPRLTGLGVGLLLAFGVLWMTTCVQQWVTSPGTSSGGLLDPAWVPHRVRESRGLNLPALPRWTLRVFGPGIVSPQYGLQPGVGLALALAVVSYGLYLVGWVALDPQRPWLGLTLPALGYLLVLALAVAWVLTLTAFWLDRFRVPTLLAVAGVAVATFILTQQDHYFPVVELPGAEPVEAPASVRSWLDAQPAGPPPAMVVVTAAGGGIRAAAWTAWVLGQLEAWIPGFHRSVALVSGVSGGAVGSMYYLDAVDQWRRLPSWARWSRLAIADHVYDRAAASSLTATAWGAVYPDLSRVFWSPVLHLTPPLVDRTWMMEQAWAGRLRGGPARLSEWTARVRSGTLPPFVFNATSVETGQRVLVGALRIVDPEGRQPVGVVHFHDLYPDRDIAVATTARLSATFPYVSPVARARRVAPAGHAADILEPQSDHLADGGYNDNFGVATAIDWLRAVRSVARQRVGAVLIVRIQLERDSSVTHLPAFLNEALGPLATLYQVREATQTARNSVALALLAAESGGGPRLCEFVFLPTLPGSRPLSWHLTNAERANIRLQWSAYEGHAEQIGRWVRGTPGDCPPPGT